MEPEKPSDDDVFVDLAAVKRMFIQLVDVHRFGDWRIFLDGSHPYLRTSILSNLYAMMKILFDVLYGMLSCEEVVRLREAYDIFHAAGGEGETFGLFFARLRAVSRRFAAEEPKWERERAKSLFRDLRTSIDDISEKLFTSDLRAAAALYPISGKFNCRI